ncbi:MAG TPA: Rne/Rng family ribonuclease [Acidimicrobiales bacterium]
MSEPEIGTPTPGEIDTDPTPTQGAARRAAAPQRAAEPRPDAGGSNGSARHAAPPPPGGGARPRIGDTRPAPRVPAHAAPVSPEPPGGPLDSNGRPPRHALQPPGTSGVNGSPPPDPRGVPTAPAARPAPSAAPAGGSARSAVAPGTVPVPEVEPRVDGVAGLVLGGEAAPVVGAGPDGAAEAARKAGRGRRRGGRERRSKMLGRYLVCVHVQPHVTQIAVLEGRSLVEHYVSRAADETTQIDGNIYRGRVQNVLPGMEAAFIDIGIPKNGVLYRGDVRYDLEDVEGGGRGSQPRIEDVLRSGQSILCQVTKNPIGAKGARLTQEVSLPGRFAVLVPNSSAFGISKRLGDNERRRLRKIVDDVRPEGHGLIVRTAAEGASAEDLRRDVANLLGRWSTIAEQAERSSAPGLLYREPDLAVRILREELNSDYRGVVIDDPVLFQQVRDYVAEVSPDLVDRVEFFDPAVEPLPIFERYHVHEQLHKALDRKVWLPSGGSLIIERTEALTVIDVNTGKNVGKSSLEETVFRNNLEAAEEVARQLRLRDIGGIIVIDFIDMEVRENREKVGAALRAALARDKTRTQVFDISELGLVEMTRKRVSEGLIESLSTVCEVCNGRGIVLDHAVLDHAVR